MTWKTPEAPRYVARKVCLATRIVTGRGVVYCGLPRHDDALPNRAWLDAATTETVEWR
jgi:hypothetical protein